jgi:hypothetical protein
MLPSPLTNVTVRQGNGQVLISWDFAPGLVSQTVQRSTDQITYSTIASPTANKYLDTSVTPGTTYYYRVAPVNGNGTGPYSVPLSVIPTISGKMTLSQIRLLAKQRADLVNSKFVTDNEWDYYINQSYFELYDILVQKFGNEYYVAEPVIFTTNGQDRYALPDGINYNGAQPHYKLLGVDLNISAGNQAWLTLKKYEFISRNRYVYPQITTNLLGVGGMRYRIVANDLTFIPTPSAGQTIRMWYIPRMVQLLQETDQVDGVSGWTEYIVIDAAIKALVKEESDTSALTLAKQLMLDRIESAAENRDAGEPEVISQTRRMNSFGWGNDGGENGGPVGGI